MTDLKYKTDPNLDPVEAEKERAKAIEDMSEIVETYAEAAEFHPDVVASKILGELLDFSSKLTVTDAEKFALDVRKLLDDQLAKRYEE